MDQELKIKIERPAGMSQEEAENALYKALSMPREGNAHQDSFQDPAMQDVANTMEQLHSQISEDMLEEILTELDKEKF